jgi:YVTN family beta-propeller protein
MSARMVQGLSHWVFGLLLVALIGARTQAASYVYAGKTDDTVVVVGTATNTEIATIQVGQEPSGIAVTPDGAFVYVVNNVSKTISVINTQTNIVATTIPFADPISEIAINPNGEFDYLNMGSPPGGPLRNLIAVLDTSTNTVVATIPLGELDSGAEDIAVTPDGRFVYVPTAGAASGGNIFVISTETNTVVDVIPSSIVTRIAFTPDGAFAYLTELEIEGKVLVLDTATKTIVARIEVREPFTGGCRQESLSRQMVPLPMSLLLRISRS